MSVEKRRGSLAWRFDRFKSDLLVQLMNDLEKREGRGLKKPECDAVKYTIGEVVSGATAYGDGGILRPAVWTALQGFQNTYVRWNGPEERTDVEAIAHRMECLKKLRKHRYKIARRIRRNQHILDNNLDLQVIDNVYSLFGNLCNTFPDVFVKVGKAVRRYYSFTKGKALPKGE